MQALALHTLFPHLWFRAAARRAHERHPAAPAFRGGLLEARRSARPRVAPGQTIRCTSGVLWITYDGEQRDIVICAGESHVRDSRAPLAVHALQRAAYEVH